MTLTWSHKSWTTQAGEGSGLGVFFSFRRFYLLKTQITMHLNVHRFILIMFSTLVHC